MAQYRVSLAQTVWEEATVYIEAANKEEAEELALQRANAGKIEWHFLEAPEPIEVMGAEEVAQTVT